MPFSLRLRPVLILQSADCKLAAGLSITIYIGSKYIHNAAHIYTAQWHLCGFKTSWGTPVKHTNLLKELRDALLLPEKPAIVRCPAHTGALGNALAEKTQVCAHGDLASSLNFIPPSVVCNVFPSFSHTEE